MFIDESAVWEEESTLNTPSKDRMQQFESAQRHELDTLTPNLSSGLSDSIDFVKQSSVQLKDLHSAIVPQPKLNKHFSVESENPIVRSSQPITEPISADSLEHTDSKGSVAADAETEDKADDSSDEELPQSQLLQKLFPAV